MKILPALMIASGLALTGCVSAEMAADNAQDLAAEQCAKRGQAFVQTGGVAESDGTVAAATAKGHCADVPPPPPPG